MYAGIGAIGFSGDGGPATSAELNLNSGNGSGPSDVAVDGAGNLFIADTVHSRVRRVDAATGIITTVAGGGTAGPGDGGPATSAVLGNPSGVAVDSAGNLFITEIARIRRVDATTQVITTVAGNGTSGYSGDGGPATSAQLHSPTGIVLDNAGNLFIADYTNQRIRRVDAATHVITTVAGNGFMDGCCNGGFSGDGGPATSAELKCAQ